MPKKRKPRSNSKRTGSNRPRPDDIERVKEFLIRQGEKTIAAEILNFLSVHDGKAFRSREIAAELGYLSDDDLPGFWYVLHKLHEEGALDKDAERRYSLARSAAPLPEVIRVREELALHADTKVAPFVPPPKQRFKVGEIYEGTLKTHPNGYGLVSVADYDDEIFLPATELRRVLDGDIVKVRVTMAPLDLHANRESFSRRFEGKLVEVVERTRTELVGVLKRRNKDFQLIPDSNRILPEIFI
jgi:ribonuclease R